MNRFRCNCRFMGVAVGGAAPVVAVDHDEAPVIDDEPPTAAPVSRRARLMVVARDYLSTYSRNSAAVRTPSADLSGFIGEESRSRSGGAIESARLDRKFSNGDGDRLYASAIRFSRSGGPGDCDVAFQICGSPSGDAHIPVGVLHRTVGSLGALLTLFTGPPAPQPMDCAERDSSALLTPMDLQRPCRVRDDEVQWVLKTA